MGRAAVVCVAHGGGPMPLLGDKMHRDIVRSLSTRVPKLLGLGTPNAPRAILVVTAHWNTRHPSISSGASPSLYYDYGGFPREAYEFKYDAPGAPEVAEEVRAALASAGFSPVMDSKRGWDHGVFVPMMLINPAANVPLVQMSVLASEDPEQHLRLGQALSSLRDSNIAILGSGFASFHNRQLMLAAMGGGGDPAKVTRILDPWNSAITAAVGQTKLEKRREALAKWREIPNSYQMHPPNGADHFMPLLVSAGAAGDDAQCAQYKDDFAGLNIWTYYWSSLSHE